MKYIINAFVAGLLILNFVPVLVAGQAPDSSVGNSPDSSVFNPTPSGSNTNGASESGRLQNPFAFSTVQEFTGKILEIIIKVGWVLAFFFIIYSGFLFVTAAGSEDQIKRAKMTFLWTVIGVAIVLGAKVISDLLQNTVTSVVQIK